MVWNAYKIAITEHTLFFSTDFRSVRLDVYANDEAEVDYDIEMENSGKMELARRSRYYQGEMDVTSLKPGEDFMNLKPSYIIFICTFDPFGKGLYRYTFKPRCEEADLYLENGTQRIFLNTKGNNASDISDELLHFLRYVEQSTTEVARTGRDEVVPRIHKRVQNIKRDRKLEVGYMYLQEYIDAEKALAREEGLAEGYAEGHAEDMQKAWQRDMQKDMQRDWQRGNPSWYLISCLR